MRYLVAAIIVFNISYAQAQQSPVSQNLSCLGSTTSDIFSGNFSTTVWPVWFQKLFNVKSLQAGEISPCMATGYVWK